MNDTVLVWLDRTAKEYADKTVFTDSSRSLTFGEFDRITKSVGTYLASRVPCGSPVVVMSGRHVVTPALFLGAVRAGCFYAPMDATMPVSRLNQILGVIKASHMLVDKDFLDIARQLDFDGELIVADDILDTPIDEALLAKASATLLPTSPLYVIFTSGSTGVPKGVITAHESLMHYINGFCKVMDMQDTDILGNQSPFDYIAAIRDIYIPL